MSGWPRTWLPKSCSHTASTCAAARRQARRGGATYKARSSGVERTASLSLLCAPLTNARWLEPHLLKSDHVQLGWPRHKHKPAAVGVHRPIHDGQLGGTWRSKEQAHAMEGVVKAAGSSSWACVHVHACSPTGEPPAAASPSRPTSEPRTLDIQARHSTCQTRDAHLSTQTPIRLGFHPVASTGGPGAAAAPPGGPLGRRCCSCCCCLWPALPHPLQRLRQG